MPTLTTFANQNGPIPLAELDANFTVPITVGSTTAALGQTVPYWPVSSGGTGLTSLSAGYIPYGNGTGALGSSPNLFYNSATTSLGIGTNSPLSTAGYGWTTINGTNGGILSLSVADTEFFRIQSFAASTNISTLTALPLIFKTNNVEGMRLSQTGKVGIGILNPISYLAIGGDATTDAPTLGTEFLTGGTWTSTGWTGDNTAGWVNGASNANPLSYSLPAVVSTRYQIAYTVTRTAGSFTIAFGGQSQAGITATGTFGPTATTTGNLVITPTSTFVGSIVISIKAITTASTAITSLADSTTAIRYEERLSSVVGNTFLGAIVGRYNTTGTYNTGVGNGALSSNTTATFNSAFGVNALQNNTTGNSNTAVGLSALQTNTIGALNVSVGVSALQSNATGVQNSAVGTNALQFNTTGNNNTAVGLSALNTNTTGSFNTGLGYSSGNAITTGSNNVILGSYTGSAAPISATGSNFVVLSDGAANIRAYYDGSGNQVTYGVQATSAAAPTIASATTIAPTKAITFISGTTAIATITAPSPISLGGGQITLIPTGIFTTTTAGNIALASTAVVGKALIMTYDVTTTKWYPSY